MQPIDRRRFVKITAAAGAALNFLYPGLASAASLLSPRQPVSADSEAPTKTGTDPRIAIGTVLEKSGQGVVLRSATGGRVVRIPPGTQVWKETFVSANVIQQGDWLDVKGTPLADGSLEASSGWVFVNIGRRDGTVRAIDVNVRRLTYDHARQGKGVAIDLSPHLEVVRRHDGATVAGGVAALVPGTEFGAVGLRLPGGGFRATRIWF